MSSGRTRSRHDAHPRHGSEAGVVEARSPTANRLRVGAGVARAAVASCNRATIAGVSTLRPRTQRGSIARAASQAAGGWRGGSLRTLMVTSLPGARVEKRESHTDLRGTQRPHSQSHCATPATSGFVGPDHSRIFVRGPRATNQAKKVVQNRVPQSVTACRSALCRLTCCLDRRWPVRCWALSCSGSRIPGVSALDRPSAGPIEVWACTLVVPISPAISSFAVAIWALLSVSSTTDFAPPGAALS